MTYRAGQKRLTNRCCYARASKMGAIDRLSSYFGFDEHNTDFTTELIAGITTFLAMSYIIVVNPTVLLPAIMGFNEQGDINQQTTIDGAVYDLNEVFQMLP